MSNFTGDYLWYLNSSDKFDPELPLLQSRTFGGTIVLWRQSIDPYITVLSTDTTALLPIKFAPPLQPITFHFTIYLPTSGKNNEFVDVISSLDQQLSCLKSDYPDALFFLRGDFNVRSDDHIRSCLLSRLMESHDLTEVVVTDHTYHHFTGSGQSDSNIDKLIFSRLAPTENLSHHLCKLSDPLIDSCHDILISKFRLNYLSAEESSVTDHIVAPRICNYRKKVIWDDTGSDNYCNIVTPALYNLQSTSRDSLSKPALSLLIKSTNEILSRAAMMTNKTIDLGKPVNKSPAKTPKLIRQSSRLLRTQYSKMLYARGTYHQDWIVFEYF